LRHASRDIPCPRRSRGIVSCSLFRRLRSNHLSPDSKESFILLIGRNLASSEKASQGPSPWRSDLYRPMPPPIWPGSIMPGPSRSLCGMQAESPCAISMSLLPNGGLHMKRASYPAPYPFCFRLCALARPHQALAGGHQQGPGARGYSPDGACCCSFPRAAVDTDGSLNKTAEAQRTNLRELQRNAGLERFL